MKEKGERGEIGGDKGWALPKSKDDGQFYNQWASKNRFKINDTVHFKYEKDSVLVVTDEEYDKCRSLHPMFFSNNGDTVFTLNRSDLFYFISGVAGHCDRGQKMVIKVLEPENPPPPENQNGTPQNSGAVEMAAFSFPAIMLIIMSFLGFAFN
ncbi:hypothetical protein L1049_016781 [Liquidambar formosana]|uniref:Phytocyanin domain-containing protein n=1 Tax=Liquidambar formosana TaxID=63359 RepID=A0AAP0S010_LIQFO